jgi:hypothetical protein
MEKMMRINRAALGSTYPNHDSNCPKKTDHAAWVAKTGNVEMM